VDPATAVARHRAAVSDYAVAARRVAEDPSLWSAAPAEGKWSPAQVTLHLILAFEAAAREVRDGVPMALRTTGWQRLILRFTIVRRLLRGGPFPRGARSPREARPAELDSARMESADVLIQRFEALAADLEAALLQRLDSGDGAGITHPYFGRMPVAESIYVSARHIEHHRTQLPG
jgi:hypothetical protein